MVKHNNVVPNVHFHKDWQRRVKTWFDQPGRKQRRRRNRAEKAAKIFPRPLENLKPVVRAPTIKYNTKLRFGRGFTFDELKAASIAPQFARTIGITVDHRRKNRSEGTFRSNVQRLVNYKNSLILFPRKKATPKKGDATAEQISTATQLKGAIQPIKRTGTKAHSRLISDKEKKISAFQTLRIARATARRVGRKKKEPKTPAAKK